jgi:ubiquinone/menaquinone biosynthesis C-methylase UbiE
VFVPDQEQAAAELLRVTKPGGTIGLTSYTSASMPADIYWVGARFLAPKPGLRPAFDWAAGQRAGELLGPGSSSVLVTPLSYGACYESARAYVDSQLQNYGPMVRRFQQMSQMERAAYTQQVMEAAERHNEATDGSLIATFDYVQIVARKAG